jgi:hypothetical protein
VTQIFTRQTVKYILVRRAGFQTLMKMEKKGWEDDQMAAVPKAKQKITVSSGILYFRFQVLTSANMNFTQKH